MNRPKDRKVVDWGSPLPLLKSRAVRKRQETAAVQDADAPNPALSGSKRDPQSREYGNFPTGHPPCATDLLHGKFPWSGERVAGWTIRFNQTFMNKIKIAQFGLGPIGIETLKLAATKPWADIVGG